MGLNALKCGVAAASFSLLVAGQAFAMDLGTLFAPLPLPNVQQANVPTDLEVAPPNAGPTRVIVKDPTEQTPGTITVDTKNRYLYLSMDGGQAVRYDIGVGRDGFTWSGQAYVARRAEWPTWTPPSEMLKRRPDIPHH